jgi:hypothetical protein
MMLARVTSPTPLGTRQARSNYQGRNGMTCALRCSAAITAPTVMNCSTSHAARATCEGHRGPR